ncbi:MAG: hypothetical protein LUF04_04275 [Bacteroides sp.]|nr:hypothetical protein [Bacteroides sp.]
MIYITGNEKILLIPRIDRCKNDLCNIYQLLLQNRSTKEITIFQLPDYYYGHPVYYGFKIHLPDWIGYGEYDLFLLSDENWDGKDINPDNPRNTIRYTDKGTISANDMLIVVNGLLLVTKHFKGRWVDATGNKVEGNKCSFTVDSESKDERLTGETFRCLDIIHTDILKYKHEYKHSSYVEPRLYKSRGNYKEYRRNGQ